MPARAPFRTRQRTWVRKMVPEQRLVGYDEIEHRDPVYGWRNEKRGTRSISVTKTVPKWMPVGTRVKWALEKLSSKQKEADDATRIEIQRGQSPPQSPTPKPTATPYPPTPTIAPRPVETPSPTGTPVPLISNPPLSSFSPPACLPGWTANLPEWANSAKDATIALGISTRVVDDLGHLGGSATQEARALTNLRGTFYNPSTVAKTIGGSVIENSLSKASVLTAVTGSAAVNLYDFQYGCEKEKGVGSPEFFASTMVDVGTSLVVGAAAALTVGAAAIALGAVLSISIPAAVVIIGATVLAGVLSTKIEQTGIPDHAKATLAGYFGKASNQSPIANVNPPMSSSFYGALPSVQTRSFVGGSYVANDSGKD